MGIAGAPSRAASTHRTVQLVRVLHDDALDAHAAEQLLGQFRRRRALEQEGHVGDDDRRAPDGQP